MATFVRKSKVEISHFHVLMPLFNFVALPFVGN